MQAAVYTIDIILLSGNETAGDETARHETARDEMVPDHNHPYIQCVKMQFILHIYDK